MHPPLFKPHELCQKVIDAFVRCHEDNPYMKYLGACNDLKVDLDKCFRDEKERARKRNAEKAKRDKQRFEEIKRKVKEEGLDVSRRP